MRMRQPPQKVGQQHHIGGLQSDLTARSPHIRPRQCARVIHAVADKCHPTPPSPITAQPQCRHRTVLLAVLPMQIQHNMGRRAVKAAAAP